MPSTEKNCLHRYNHSLISLKELPEDVIIDILSHVPTRYILHFKSVCKSWYALFQNLNFISKHFQNQSTISDASFIFTLEKYTTPTSTSDHTVGFLILSDSSYKSIKIPIVIDVLKPLDVCGSCNGLICLSILRLDSIILLWNPFTGVFKELPTSPIDHLRANHPSQVVFGFGFDDVVRDYKVLRILPYGPLLKQVEIYSLSTNSWREIQTPIPLFYFNESACRVFLNGKFHWEAERVHNLGNHEVAARFQVFNHVGSLIPIDGGKVATRANLSCVVPDAFFV
ncbi:LOW QUALITY PROTEIN: putative F-box protein At3g20705 [Rutidosis leptorrhynchoides]|uniref:LOW QUALITY PROTEIN: putative F-box protein At3g20705 n=1 Tax=Rutidosis leptorrhynchoides TaxID=125765 RepID=UPI003A99FB4C